MRSLSAVIICIAALGSSLVEAGPHQARSVRESSPLTKRGDLNCDGSALCWDGMGGECASAEKKIAPKMLYHTRGSSEETGVCSDTCGIFVEGDDCDLSGEEMIKGVNELWHDGECKGCGQKVYEDGCKLTMNYVSDC